MHVFHHRTYVGYVAVVGIGSLPLSRQDILYIHLPAVQFVTHLSFHHVFARTLPVVVEHAHRVGSVILVAGAVLAVFAFVVVEQVEAQGGIRGKGVQVIHAGKVRAVVQII